MKQRLVAFRCGGLLTLSLLKWRLRLLGSPVSDLPPPGFVGRMSSSFLATDHQRLRPISIRLSHDPAMSNALQWRLTCVWES